MVRKRNSSKKRLRRRPSVRGLENRSFGTKNAKLYNIYKIYENYLYINFGVTERKIKNETVFVTGLCYNVVKVGAMSNIILGKKCALYKTEKSKPHESVGRKA